MSRIGIKPVFLPTGITLEVRDGQIYARGTKGNLTHFLPEFIDVTVADGKVMVARQNDNRQARANHGLVRSLINSMVIGVSEGFEKRLEMVGTGYRVASKGAGLSLTVGFSHPVLLDPVPGITFSLEGNNIIIIKGADKALVGQVAANIRKIRPPEPYKGKGIRYADEHVRRKQGKTSVK